MRKIILLSLLLVSSVALAKVKVTKLAQKLLYGNAETRAEAIQAFNKLPADAQYKLVPDFMVALTDDDPQVRKIASRILKAMGVKTETQIPAAQPATPPTTGEDKWAEEKKMRDQGLTPPAPGQEQWGDLKKMQAEESGHYAALEEELRKEKRGKVTLDAAELRTDAAAATTPLSAVVDMLNDPDPWMRAQAARRLAMVHPAPVETIPTLIHMLDDKEAESRRAAAAALGSFGPLAKDAAPRLRQALADPDDVVSQIAREALKQIQLPQ